MFIFSYEWRVVFAKEIRVRVSWVGVRVGPTIGKPQIQSLSQIFPEQQQQQQRPFNGL